MILSGLISPFVGWLIDRIGPKRIYLAGISFMAFSYLIYALAGSWAITILAMSGYWMGMSASGLSCATICGNCLVNQDRATGMLICETVAAGILGMAGPMLATLLVTQSGGVNVGGIRPLFFSGFVVTVASFAVVLTQLSDRRWSKQVRAKPHLVKDISEIFKGGKNLKRWLVIATVSHLPLGMIFPFTQVFAYSIKGADAFTLGAMVAGSALASIVVAIPLGRLADRIGRKRVLYMTIPLFWVSNLLLIWAPSQVFLIIAGVLQGFYYIGAPVSIAIEREMVPAEHMGRWAGVNRGIRMVVGAILALASGIIWDKIGPQYVFLTFVGLDLLVRIPLLISLPETLHTQAASPLDKGRP
jgi:MFS family permease